MSKLGIIVFAFILSMRLLLFDLFPGISGQATVQNNLIMRWIFFIENGSKLPRILVAKGWVEFFIIFAIALTVTYFFVVVIAISHRSSANGDLSCFRNPHQNLSDWKSFLKLALVLGVILVVGYKCVYYYPLIAKLVDNYSNNGKIDFMKIQFFDKNYNIYSKFLYSYALHLLVSYCLWFNETRNVELRGIYPQCCQPKTSILLYLSFIVGIAQMVIFINWGLVIVAGIENTVLVWHIYH